MARLFATANRVVAALSENTALLINRRGYAAAAAASESLTAENSAVTMNKSTEALANSTPSSSWVPDPVTGYYRPANHVDEVDPAELRAMLLSWNKPRH